jgi:hypothetical protein
MVGRLEARMALRLAEPDAQREAAEAEAAKLRVRPLVHSVELAETVAVRFWIRAVVFSAPALEPPVASAAKEKAVADWRQVACHLLTAAVVRQLRAAVVRLWFPAQPASVPGQERPAKEQAAADPRPVACRLSEAAVARLILAAAVQLWFPARPASALGQGEPAKEQAAAADPRQAACRVPVASQRAAPDREPERLAESYSEPVSPLERPTAEAKARARPQRRLQQCRQQQRLHLVMILRQQLETAVLEAAVQQLETAVGMQGTEPAARLSDSARLDWSP